MKIVKVSLYVISVFLFTSCATIRSESVYSIPVSTVPDSSTIKVFDKKGRNIIVTQSPDTLILKAGDGYFKRAEYLIEVSHKNYITKKEPIYFVIDRKYIQNVFLSFFMPIGFLIVDPISGAMWQPEKQEIKINLIEGE